MNTQLEDRPKADTTAKIAVPNTQRGPIAATPIENKSDERTASRRWITVLVAAAAAIGVWVTVADSPAPTTTDVDQPAFDSPGGNSLNVPNVDRFPGAPGGFDSPGGNSLGNF